MDSTLGKCCRMFDARLELVCDKDAAEEVIVRNRFGHFTVRLCEECGVEYAEFFRSLRSPKEPNPPGRRRRVSRTRGRSSA